MFHLFLTNLTTTILKPEKRKATILCVPNPVKSAVHQRPLIIEVEPSLVHHSPLNVDTNSAHLSHNMFYTRNPKSPLPDCSHATRRSNRHRGQASLFSPSWSSAVSFVLYGCPHLSVCPFIPASSP